MTNDASNLTIGPTLHGNPLKSLLARKKQREGGATPDLVDAAHDINTFGPVTSTIAFTGSQHKSSMQLIEESKNISSRIENKELRDEILKWKKDHSKKLEERKKYFEPQILKIEDDDDNPPSPISDNENEQIDVDYYDSVTSRRSAGSREPVQQTRPYTAAPSSSSNKNSRLESMFKKSFHNEDAAELAHSNSHRNDLNVLEPIRRKHHHSNGRLTPTNLPDEAMSSSSRRDGSQSRRRSSSRDRVLKSSGSVGKLKQQFEEDEQFSIIPSPPTTSMSFERREIGSGSSSRVATGDTGYASVGSESGSYS